MNIKFILRGTKDIRKIYVRMYQSNMDISLPTSLILNNTFWNSVKENSTNDERLNLILQKLKLAIVERFNYDYASEIIIDKDWLRGVISEHFKRDFNEKNLSNPKEKIYLSDFCDFWLKTEAKKWKVSARKFMDDGLIGQYQRFVDILKSYEKSSEKIKLLEVTQDKIYDFVSFLEEQDYNSSTINRHITRLKFFCNRALELNIKVNKNFNQRIFVENTKEHDDIYLNEEEISSILKLDLSHDTKLTNVRDYFVIALHTGFRISDLLETLKLEDISNDYIELKTKKTGQSVVLPVHQEIKEVIKRNFGFLPPKIDRTTYNKEIKNICMLAGIDSMTYGSKYDSEKQRKVLGYYSKADLVTSHTCRRSFASIYYGVIPSEDLCSILGWSNDKMLLFYNKKTKKEKANNLKKHWDGNK